MKSWGFTPCSVRYAAAADVFAMFSDGRIFYRPNVGFVGTDSFIYTVTDGTGSDVGTVTVTVLGPNRPPVIDDQTFTAVEDTPLDGRLQAFIEAHRLLKNRIDAFISLPLKSIDTLALGPKLREVGRMQVSTSTRDRAS